MRISDKFIKIYSRDNIPTMKPDINSAIALEKDISLKYNQKNQYYFFDDLLENLKSVKQRGWITIWISPLYYTKDKFPFIDHAYSDIKTALYYLQ